MDDGSAWIELRRMKGPSLWAVVDVVDLARVNMHRWRAQVREHTTYAHATAKVDGREIDLRLHRFIMDAPDDASVDHVDGDGLNNRRSNLRLAVGHAQRANTRAGRGTSSRYKGVAWSKSGRKWQAQIKRTYLGSFDTEVAAARAYDAAAAEMYGEFALLNFPADPGGRSAILSDGTAA